VALTALHLSEIEPTNEREPLCALAAVVSIPTADEPALPLRPKSSTHGCPPSRRSKPPSLTNALAGQGASPTTVRSSMAKLRLTVTELEQPLPEPLPRLANASKRMGTVVPLSPSGRHSLRVCADAVGTSQPAEWPPSETASALFAVAL